MHCVCCQRGATASQVVKEGVSVQVLANFGSLPSFSARRAPPAPSPRALLCAPQLVLAEEGFLGRPRGARAGGSRGGPARVSFTGLFYSAPKHQLCSSVTGGGRSHPTALLSPALEWLFLSVAAQSEQIWLYSVHARSIPTSQPVTRPLFEETYLGFSPGFVALSVFQHPSLSWSV